MLTWRSWPHLPKGLCFAEDISKVPTLSFQIPKGYLKWNKKQEFSGWLLQYVGSQKNPLEKGNTTYSKFWPRQFLGVYSPWGRKESDKIVWLNNNSNEVSPFVKQRNQQYLHDCVHVQVLIRVQLFAALWPVAPKILYPWNFSGKNTEMECHFHLQGIFPIQGLNPGLLHFTIYIGWQVLFCWTVWETTHYITGLF